MSTKYAADRNIKEDSRDFYRSENRKAAKKINQTLARTTLRTSENLKGVEVLSENLRARRYS